MPHAASISMSHAMALATGEDHMEEAAAVATRPPPVQVKTLATAYWQSEI